MYTTRSWVLAENARSAVVGALGWMVAGLGATAATALLVLASLPLWRPLYTGWGLFVLLAAELALVWYLSSRLAARAMAPAEAKVLFLLYAISLGFVVAPVVALAPGAAAAALLVAAGTFAAAAAYGALTETDLQPLGTFLFMAVVGLLLALVVNALLLHGALTFWVSLLAVVLFSGLTAYDLQRLRRWGVVGEDGAILGALSLYLDFVNLFLFVFTLFTGTRRR